MGKKATARDAQLILQLYDLRSEAELRKARNWWMTEFWPNNVDDFLKVALATGAPENNWLRLVQSYWGIAASFVLEGVLHEDLFLRPAFSGEMFAIFAKVYPFLPELREKMADAKVFHDVETVIMGSKWGRERLKFMVKRMAEWRERMTAKAADG